MNKGECLWVCDDVFSPKSVFLNLFKLYNPTWAECLYNWLGNFIFLDSSPETLEAHKIKMAFFTYPTLTEICRRLVSHYFLLTEEELTMWEEDPEGFSKNRFFSFCMAFLPFHKYVSSIWIHIIILCFSIAFLVWELWFLKIIILSTNWEAENEWLFKYRIFSGKKT